MLIYPAIDLRGGRCVRLRQGDYSQETVFGDDPAAVGRRRAGGGAALLHHRGHDGARAGRPRNGASVRSIVHAAGVPCQLGGGIRTDEHVAEVLSWGVSRVIIGTKALRDPAWCEALARRHPGKVVLGLDARDGKVAVAGWLEGSEVTALALARRAAAWPLAAVVYTDIGRDGMLAGPDAEGTAALARAVPGLPVIASGGVTTLDDVARLARAGIHGAIVGRALYEGRLDLAGAIALAKDLSLPT